MALFADSSQRRHWLFSAEDLAAARAMAFEAPGGEPRGFAARAAPRSQPLAAPGAPEAAAAAAQVQAVWAARHARLLLLLGAQLGCSDAVQATAVAYLQRFFLSNSVAAWDAKKIMLTCLFTASKVVEEPLAAARIAGAVEGGPSEEDVLSHEMHLLEALGFHLITFSPHRALVALVEATMPDADGQARVDAHAAAAERARAAVVTDASLLATPAQVALAALRPDADAPELAQLLAAVFPDEPDAAAALRGVQLAQALIREELAADPKAWKRLEKEAQKRIRAAAQL